MKLFYLIFLAFCLFPPGFLAQNFEETPKIFHSQQIVAEKPVKIEIKETPFLRFKEKGLSRVFFEEIPLKSKETPQNLTIYSKTPKFVDKLPEESALNQELDAVLREIKGN